MKVIIYRDKETKRMRKSSSCMVFFPAIAERTHVKLQVLHK